jgi:WGR domain superfamily
MILEKGTRYYEINIVPTLFYEYCVERIYGNKTYKKPTRELNIYFSSKTQAMAHFKKILNSKLKKGYVTAI